MVTYNLDRFFDLTPDLFCIAGYDGYFKKINPAVSELLGYTNQELFAKPISEFIYFEDRDITAKHRDDLKKDIPLLNYENRYVKKNGDIVWLSWTSMPVEAEQTVYAIAKNITYKKKIEDDRNRLIENLTRINNDQKQLSYVTSHDLRSPVNNLLSVFKMMNTSKIQDTETLEFIDVLRAATESLKDTLNTYVDAFSANGSLEVTVGELTLEACLKVVLHSLNALIKESNATINFEFTAFSTINFNKAYLESIFLNLITNSIKYARLNVAPVISIQTKIVKGIRQLVFTDNGVGFDMKKVKGKLFGFNQKFNDSPDSKGIGLYLVYNHVTSLGGHIALYSIPNEGATFTISFKN
ncbi:sensor histidine kinase [Mucilaginibacter glaciei]|uniref:histidine kinase n=1 Tax=Mucilaginibacter glaciei TaxID=2772109 RepID=A0A926NP96_9SPHI|nr:PAS domain-containing sensor histidine kinase [Mucilaginibacter glaciei]MBD1392898.1 PAS domain-containing sensor histidine kinase [Mucilaginibacter glaciei]